MTLTPNDVTSVSIHEDVHHPPKSSSTDAIASVTRQVPVDLPTARLTLKVLRRFLFLKVISHVDRTFSS